MWSRSRPADVSWPLGFLPSSRPRSSECWRSCRTHQIETQSLEIWSRDLSDLDGHEGKIITVNYICWVPQCEGAVYSPLLCFPFLPSSCWASIIFWRTSSAFCQTGTCLTSMPQKINSSSGDTRSHLLLFFIHVHLLPHVNACGLQQSSSQSLLNNECCLEGKWRCQTARRYISRLARRLGK